MLKNILRKKSKTEMQGYSLYEHQTKTIRDLSSTLQINKSMLVRFCVVAGMSVLKKLTVNQMRTLIEHQETRLVLDEYPILEKTVELPEWLRKERSK